MKIDEEKQSFNRQTIFILRIFQKNQKFTKLDKLEQRNIIKFQQGNWTQAAKTIDNFRIIFLKQTS